LIPEVHEGHRDREGAVPFILLPGNMCDQRVWAGIPDALRTDGRTVHFADFSCQTSIAEMARDVLAGAPDGRFFLGGFSMGAIVALELARVAPERIAGLVLIALNASADLPERSAVRPAQQLRASAGQLAQVVKDELKPHYLSLGKRDDPAILRLTMRMALDLGPEVFVRQSEALRTRPDLRPVLSRIGVPTLLLCGAEDALCPPQWHQAWADMIGPGAALTVVEEAGHLLPLEQPEKTAEAVLAWLSSMRFE
jgi:pimeloyl-ACP methyl ester carboxylesterase